MSHLLEDTGKGGSRSNCQGWQTNLFPVRRLDKDTEEACFLLQMMDKHPTDCFPQKAYHGSGNISRCGRKKWIPEGYEEDRLGV